jgi:hypothetical protein
MISQALPGAGYVGYQWEDRLEKPYGIGTVALPYTTMELKEGMNSYNETRIRRENVLIKLYKAATLRCCPTRVGNVAIFDMSSEDVLVLNSFFYILANQAHVKSLANYYDAQNTQFFRMDNSTRIFNNQSEPIGRELVTSAFNGKVCIKVMGFQENLRTNEISLLAHVHQVKVEKAEEEEVFESGCLF